MKRKNGEGTWGVKTIKGTEYRFFRNTNGKYFYGKTQKEIKEKIEKYNADNVSDNSYNVVFSDFFKNWLYKIKQPQVKRRTFDGYEQYYKNLIVGKQDKTISDIKLTKLTAKNISDFYNALAEKYSLATIKKIHTLINQCLTYAIDEKIIELNPAAKAVIPSEDIVAKPKKEIPFLSIEDMEKLYQESKRIKNPDDITIGLNEKINEELFYGNNAKFIVLIMYTGMRTAEMLGLKWKDVDLDKKCIYVNRNVSKVVNRSEKKKESDNKYIRVETTLKRDNSKRTIPLSDRALEVLLYLKSNNKSTKNDDYVCMTQEGTLVNERNVSRTLNIMLKRAGCEVDRCGLHSLRHSFGSYLVSQGVDISVVSRLLGHKSITVTYNVYIHVLKQSQIDAVSLFNK